MQTHRTAEQDKMWNFLYVKRHIQAFVLPGKGEHEAKKKFLEAISQYTDSQIAVIRGILHADTFYTECNNKIIDEIVEKYVAAHAESWVAAEHLNLMLADEFKRYYREDENSAERKSQAYLDLLQTLTTCCLGVINNPITRELYKVHKKITPVADRHTGEAADPDLYDVYRWVKNYLRLHRIHYDMALAAGGRFYPDSQGYDPMIGTRISKQGKYDLDGGHCQGRVAAWAKRIAVSGKPELLTLIDGETHDLQNRPIKSVMPSKISDYGTAGNAAGAILKDVEHGFIYCLILAGKPASHAIGIRRVPGTGMIEWMDPNSGCLTFQDESKFADFFQLIHSSSCVFDAIYYSKFVMVKLEKQYMNTDVSDQYVPINPGPANCLNKHVTKKAYEKFFSRLGFFYEHGVPNELKAYHYKRAFIENCLVRIKYTNDRDVLLWLKDVFLTDPNRAKNDANTFPIVEVIKNSSDKVTGFKLWNMISRKKEEDSFTKLVDAIDNRLLELDKTTAPQHK